MKTSRLSRHWNEAGLAPAFSLPLSAACFLVDTPATGDRKRKREEKKGRKRGHSTFLVFFSSSGLRQRDPLPRRGPEKVECPFFFFLHTDHLNTPRLATDKTQTVLWRWEGEAFGGTAPNEDTDGDHLRIILNLRFPGQYHDSESDLYYNWNRYYDPKTGRYITSDPVGLEGALNTYAYVANGPYRWVDPFGLFCIPFPDEATDWKTYSRGNPFYQLGQPLVVNGVGSCFWTRITPVRQERMVRSRQLCWECATDCGGGGCGLRMKYGPWRRQNRPSDERESRITPVIAWSSDGRDPERPDVGFCNNPWTGQRVIIQFRAGP